MAVAFVNEATFANNAGVSSFNITIPSTTAGNMLTLSVGTKDAPDEVTGITGGGTWQRAVTAGTGGVASQASEIWYCMNCSAGVTSLSVTLAGNTRVVAWYGEFSGLATSAALDVTAATIGSSTTPSPGAITPSQANGLALGMCQFVNTSTTVSSGPTGWTRPTSGNVESAAGSASGTEMDAAYKIDPGTSSDTPTWTIGTSRNWGAAVAVFKPASGGSTPIAGADTGAGADTATVAPAITGTDTGSGADSGSLTASLAASDTGVGVDSAVVDVVADPKVGADTGAGVDTSIVAAGIAASDTAVGADSAVTTATLTGTDIGAGVDATSLTVNITASDTGTGVDAASIADIGATQKSGADTATATDTGAVTAGIVAVTDTATATESASVVITLLTFKFSPPSHEEPIRSELGALNRFRLTYAKTILRRNGVFIAVRSPDPSWVVGEAGVDYFIGGHVYDITPATKAELEAAGYTV